MFALASATAQLRTHGQCLMVGVRQADRGECRLLVHRALEGDPPLRSGLAEVRYEEGEIQAEIAAEAEAVWEVALDEIRRYDAAQSQLEDLRSKVSAEAGPAPKKVQVKVRCRSGSAR